MATPSQFVRTPADDRTAYIESIDPSSEEVIGRFEVTQPDQLTDIFARARQAQREWAARPMRERCQAIRRLRDAIYERREEIANVISRETGKPRVEALFAEILLALDTADFFARNAARWLRPERVPYHNIALKTKSGWLMYEPYGIVAVISPWNYPFSIPLSQLVPGVLAGNAVLLKPSELTPWCGALVGELFEKAGVPDGLVQVLQGAAEIGAALVEAGPDKVFFTGSVATGRRIAETCGRKLIPSALELGGKDAMIVLADADMDIASSAAVWGAYTNCGQACLSVERIYVEQGVADRFTELCVEKSRKLRLGPPGDPDAEIGPMIRERQVERVELQLRDAVTRGARILTGGRRQPDLGRNYFEPTVAAGVDHSMQLMQEETFGPVLAIRPVANAEEAVQFANDSPFGLSASVWTGDVRRGREIAAQLHAGSVMVNDVASYYGVTEAPHGGRGVSGWGRSHSRLGLLEMVQVKYVDVDRLPRVAKSWWFGYDKGLAIAAGQFIDFLFAPRWRRRWSSLLRRRGVLGTVFRGHRI
jgi:succinate-semialdehyde dehydrogenase/glutarate-semialdehyde dehydrogenase